MHQRGEQAACGQQVESTSKKVVEYSVAKVHPFNLSFYPVYYLCRHIQEFGDQLFIPLVLYFTLPHMSTLTPH